MSDTRVLKAIELTKIFPHPSKAETFIPLFAGASFEMTSNKSNFVIGVSGSGKTTLLRIISSLESINAGELFLDEIVIHKLKGKEKIGYLRRLGFMDQFPAKYLSMNLSVKHNLDYTLTLYTSLQKEERKKRITDLATNLNIVNLLEKKTINLSGGELRRLNLACSIIFEPSILLCDEPTAQLDEENKQKVMETIRKMQEYYNTMLIIATHDHTIIKSNPLFEISKRVITRCQ